MMKSYTIPALVFRVLIGLTLAAAVGTASGAECQNVSFPDQIQSADGTLKLNGLGLRQATFLKIDVYVAALYVAEKSGDANTIFASKSPKELVLHFVRDVDRDDIVKAWDEGFEHNAGNQLAELGERIASFKGLMTAMSSGQRMRFAYRPDVGIEVDMNSTVVGTIAGDDFAQALFSIWLGPHPPNADLKTGLLGGPCE